MESIVFVSLAVFCILVSSSYGLPMDSCASCKANIAAVKEGVLRQIRQQPMETVLEAVCDSAPTMIKADCYSLSREQIAALVSQLGGADSDGVCEALGQCGAAGYRALMLAGDTDLALRFDTEGTPFFHGMMCRMCTTTMTIVNGYLHDKGHQAAILGIMKHVCHFLPLVSKECSVLVEQYGHLIITLVSHFLTPHLCYSFHICNKEPVTVMDDLCVPCEIGAGVMQDFVSDPNSEGEVRTLAREFCSQLAEGTDQTCESKVDEYLPGVFTYLRSVQYGSVCTTLMSCETKDVEIAGHV